MCFNAVVVKVHRQGVVLCCRPRYLVLRHPEVCVEFVLAIAGIPGLAEDLHRPVHAIPDEGRRSLP
mgnify:CR=1 FL=1